MSAMLTLGSTVYAPRSISTGVLRRHDAAGRRCGHVCRAGPPKRAAARQPVMEATRHPTAPVAKPAAGMGLERRELLLGLGGLGLALAAPEAAEAKTVNLTIKDVTTKLCANPNAGGTPGTATYKAKCFEVLGTVVNPSKETVFNADVYGVVLDATNDPVLRSGRVGSIETCPPGESPFRLEITVANSQPTPLKTKNFKAQGFLGTVNRSGNPYDMDYESGSYAGGNKTNI